MSQAIDLIDVRNARIMWEIDGLTDAAADERLYRA